MTTDRDFVGLPRDPKGDDWLRIIIVRSKNKLEIVAFNARNNAHTISEHLQNNFQISLKRVFWTWKAKN